VKLQDGGSTDDKICFVMILAYWKKACEVWYGGKLYTCLHIIPNYCS